MGGTKAEKPGGRTEFACGKAGVEKMEAENEEGEEGKEHGKCHKHKGR